MSDAAETVRGHIRALQEARAFVRAYAARDVPDDRDDPSGERLRDALARAQEAADGIPKGLRELVAREDMESVDAWGEMLEVVEEDARRARAAIRLVRGEAAVGSRLAEALEANLHLQVFLADLALVEEALGR